MFPLIRYCVSVWGSSTVTQQRRLQTCINLGICIVEGLGRRDRVTVSLRELGWLKVDELVCEHDLLIMYDLLHCINAPDLIRCPCT